jgi:hypothetical protein
MGTGGIASRVVNLGIRREYSVSHATSSTLWYSLVRALGGPQSRSKSFGERETFAFARNKILIFQFLASMHTELTRPLSLNN